MTQYVYLLWDHNEDGPTNLVATLEKEKVFDLALKVANGLYSEDSYILKSLKEAIDINEPDIYYLAEYDWGSLHLQIVELS